MRILARVGIVFLLMILIFAIDEINRVAPLGSIPYVVSLGIVIYSTRFLWDKTKKPKEVSDKSNIGKNGFTEMMWACEASDEVLVRKLIAAGNNPNDVDDNGANALMYAASYGNKNIVTALLENGATANAQTKQGGTALKFAVKEGHSEIAKILRDWKV